MVHADVGEKVILGCKGLVLNAASIWLLQRLAVCTVHDELDDLLENADGRIRLALVLATQLKEMANGALELVVPWSNDRMYFMKFLVLHPLFLFF